MKKGFTLMEMVLVMVVIVILFLLTIPNISKTLSVVNEKGCDAQVKVIDAAILQYILTIDQTPTSLGQLVSEGFISERQTTCQNGTGIVIENGKARIE